MRPPLPRNAAPTRALCTAAASAVESAPAAPARKLPAVLRSKRRLAASPSLPPEAVAVAPAVQAHVERMMRELSLSPRDVRKGGRAVVRAAHAGATASKKLKRVCGAPRVAEVADYNDPATGLAGLVTTGPQALASATYVMAELRRCRPRFEPRSMLDFGAGGAPAVSAAGRVFRSGAGVQAGGDEAGGRVADAASFDGEEEEEAFDRGRVGEGIGRPRDDWSLPGRAALKRVVLVDSSPAQRSLGLSVLAADPSGVNVHTTAAPSLRDAPMGRGAFDIVSASYALSDVVRETMTMRQEVVGAEERLWRPRREALAESRLKRTVKDLWSRVAPGGMLVVVEHGTLAGFETVLFARDTILQLGTKAKQTGEVADSRDDAVRADAVLSDETASSIQMIDEVEDVGPASGAKEEKDTSLLGARVVAPCLHSEACPLQGTATRARVCRFIQRLNRPLFLRNTMRRPTGHEDTVFSYIVIERPNAASAAAEAGTVHEEYEDGYWGRLVREPLRRGKHVVLDACTVEGKLERRVSSKKNGAPGMYAIARKVRWGDVWPQPAPASKPQEVMF